MTTAPASESVLRRAHRPADDSAALVDLTVGAVTGAAGGQPRRATAIVGVRHDGSPARLTYAQLYDEAARVATALSALAERGSYVALWAPNVLEWPVIQYGAALAGMVLVALNPALRAEELEYALTHSGASVLLHADANRDYDLAERRGQRGDRAAEPGVHLAVGTGRGWQAADVNTAVLDAAPTDPDEAVMLQYTSGTTGRPKGVLLKHRSLVNVAKLTLEAVEVEAGSVCLNPLPMFHTAGCVIATLGPLWIGGTVVLVERFRPAPVLEALRRERVSVLFYVPRSSARCWSVSAPRPPRRRS